MGLLLIEVDMESDYDSISTVLDSREIIQTRTSQEVDHGDGFFF